MFLIYSINCGNFYFSLFLSEFCHNMRQKNTARKKITLSSIKRLDFIESRPWPLFDDRRARARWRLLLCHAGEIRWSTAGKIERMSHGSYAKPDVAFSCWHLRNAIRPIRRFCAAQSKNPWYQDSRSWQSINHLNGSKNQISRRSIPIRQ